MAAVAGIAVATALDVPLPPCPLRALTGIPCPGCGSARCIGALLDGDLIAAFSYNALVPMALLLLLWAGVSAAAANAGRRLWHPLGERHASRVVGVAIAGFWIVRLVPLGA